MSSLEQGDMKNGQRAGDVKSPESLINRLTERHKQAKAANLRQAQLGRSTGGHTDTTDFLSQFLQTKTSILEDLEETAAQNRQSALPVHELTKILDDALKRVEQMQKWLNDSSLYLTSFDTEQARLELKSLNAQFQKKREELLPPKKFTFSRKRLPSSKDQPTATPGTPDTEESHLRSHCRNPSALSEFDERYSLVNVQGPCRLRLPKSDEDSGELKGQSVFLADLTNCTVEVRGVCGNLIARRLTRCQIYTYPVAGSVWIEDCHNCDLVLACRQLRIHQTDNCRLALHMASRPIIEFSSSLTVAPYLWTYPELDRHLCDAGLTPDINLWREVEDFSHPNKRLTTGSPNWSILPESEWKSLLPISNDGSK
ncbi:unnamed protein product [Calicophoron daubneyi]|uniref:C-CAP/cofactor C-like domain-containing protein n=1 Tax=Calicophoron daubneyi TaxID=300641 RepID=A0AAV2TIW1_CALDB